MLLRGHPANDLDPGTTGSECEANRLEKQAETSEGQGAVTIERARELLKYDVDSGALLWRSSWGRAKAGRRAGFVKKRPTGYNVRYVGVDGTYYREHRLAWFIHYGSWPQNEIDHINGDATDNRLSNLREVSRSENMRNTKRYSTNESGFIGVGFHRPSGKWQSYIKVDRKLKHLGFFDNIEDAAAARKVAERIHDFHQNHGRQVD